MHKNGNEASNIHIFHPNTERTYYLDNLLTIDNESLIKTMKISEWLREDPISFDKTRRKHCLKVNREIFELLVSKLRVYHSEYFKNTLGLKTRIVFKGYDRQVQASVPYFNEPVNFYKWWCLNQDVVNMSLEEKIRLFDKVYLEKPNTLKKEHKKLIHKE